MNNLSQEDSINKRDYMRGAQAGFPIIIGYLSVGLAFGLLAKTTGITLLESILFSSVVYAGSSQFMALSLIAIGTGALGIIITTFLVNFRHFLMSASLSAKLKKGADRFLPLIAFGVTDETFSVASFEKGLLTSEYLLGLNFVSYASWNVGTFLGYVLGSALPPSLQASMGVAIYAMFIALVTPKAKASHKVASLVIMSGIVNSLVEKFTSLPQGWTIIIAIFAVSAFGLFMFDDKEMETL